MISMEITEPAEPLLGISLKVVILEKGWDVKRLLGAVKVKVAGGMVEMDGNIPFWKLIMWLTEMWIGWILWYLCLLTSLQHTLESQCPYLPKVVI